MEPGEGVQLLERDREMTQSHLASKEQKLLVNPVVGEKKPLKAPMGASTANEVLLVSVQDSGGGVFKPAEGEHEMEIPETQGNLYKRERAAYLVDSALRFGIVPPTVIREIDGQVGSVQEFLQDSKGPWESADKSALRDELYRMGVLDYTIWNNDRNSFNYLLEDSQDVEDNGHKEKVRGIDHGVSFDEWRRPMLKSTLDDDPAPEDIVEKFNGFLSDPERQSDLRAQLSELLPQRAVDATFARISHTRDLLAQKGGITEDDAKEYFPQ